MLGRVGVDMRVMTAVVACLGLATTAQADGDTGSRLPEARLVSLEVRGDGCPATGTLEATVATRLGRRGLMNSMDAALEVNATLRHVEDEWRGTLRVVDTRAAVFSLRESRLRAETCSALYDGRAPRVCHRERASRLLDTPERSADCGAVAPRHAPATPHR